MSWSSLQHIKRQVNNSLNEQISRAVQRKVEKQLEYSRPIGNKVRFRLLFTGSYTQTTPQSVTGIVSRVCHLEDAFSIPCISHKDPPVGCGRSKCSQCGSTSVFLLLLVHWREICRHRINPTGTSFPRTYSSEMNAVIFVLSAQTCHMMVYFQLTFPVSDGTTQRFEISALCFERL